MTVQAIRETKIDFAQSGLLPDAIGRAVVTLFHNDQTGGEAVELSVPFEDNAGEGRIVFILPADELRSAIRPRPTPSSAQLDAEDRARGGP